MDNINLKEARKFLKQEIASLKTDIIVKKREFREAQRLVAKFFFQNKLNPYQWYFKDSVPQINYKETPEDYKKRCDLWADYLKTSPYKCLPFYTYDTGEKETITCLHVLYNHLRNTKKHTKDDSRYETNFVYKDMLQRLVLHFPLQTETPEACDRTSQGGCDGAQNV